MLRKRFAVILLAAAAAACSDTPTQSVALSPRPEAPVLQSFQGTLVAGSLLRSKEGRLISLAGWQTYLFGKLLGADVHIEGTANNDLEEGIYVNDFILLTLDGFPVMDGVLGAREEGYFIRARTG